VRQRPGALVTADNGVTLQARARIVTFAAANRLPALYLRISAMVTARFRIIVTSNSKCREAC
jgi:hypothetical protein